MEIAVLVDRDEAKNVEEEERDKFLKNVLLQIGLEQINDLWPDVHLSVEQKMSLNKFLKTQDIDIIHDGDRGYKVYVGDEVIAEWFKPRFSYKLDMKAKSVSKRYYYEMILSFCSVFETEEQNE
jgi:hypothetical protein